LWWRELLDIFKEPRMNATSQGPNLRPKAAAEYLGIGLSTFSEKAAKDSDFPKLLKLSSRISLVTR
jgi:predicted DNA-binding transcriptional regulator AlpA